MRTRTELAKEEVDRDEGVGKIRALVDTISTVFHRGDIADRSEKDRVGFSYTKSGPGVYR